MKRILLLVSTALIFQFSSSAQDGKLISMDEYVFADSTIAKLLKVFPEAKDVLGSSAFRPSPTYLMA